MFKKKKISRSLIGCRPGAGEVVNYVGIYGSKAAEGLSAFQRRSCFQQREGAPVVRINGSYIHKGIRSNVKFSRNMKITIIS